MKKLFLTFVMFGFIVCAAAKSLPIKGKQTGGEIFLRWAATDVGLWRKAQQQGFLVERFSADTMSWNGRLRDDIVRDRFWIVKPRSVSDTATWLALEDDGAAMLTAQTLVQEVDMHNDTLSYIMAMLACDRSFTAACMAGFGLKDTLQSEKQRCFYRISLQGTDVFGEWRAAETDADRTVGELQAEVSDRSVMLSIKASSSFSAYYFERAAKRGDFKRLHAVPLTVFGNDTAQTVFYRDTVEKYNTVYRYRVVGLDIFGETNIASQEVSVKCTVPAVSVYDTLMSSRVVTGKDTVPPPPPYLTACTQDSGGIVSLVWKKPTGKYGRDIEGYRVFRSYGSPERFGQITSYPVSDTFFTDTVSKKVHRKIFYLIKAIDSVGNESKRSNILFAENPLPNMPAPALVVSCVPADEYKALLKWINSPDSDTRGHRIFMRRDSGQWIFAADIPYKKNTEDSPDSISIAVKEGGIYHFDVRAYTDNAEVSAPFFAVYAFAGTAVTPWFEAISLRDKLCIVLQWKQSEVREVRKAYVYRRNTTENDTAQQNFILIKTLSETELSQGAYNDKNIKIGNIYQYKIQYEFKSGALSEYSRAINTEY